MTKQERERVRRHAAVIAATALWQRSAPRPVEGDDRCRGLRRWRGDDADGAAEPRQLVTQPCWRAGSVC